MRLFYAILPSEDCVQTLWQTRETLRTKLASASFTKRNNIHLTVQFLGETNRLEAAVDCMASLDAAPFRLAFKGIGRFKREDGDILWAAAKPQPALDALGAALRKNLLAAGFSFDAKPLRGHITLARRAIYPAGLSFAALSPLLPSCETAVDTLVLMRSERQNGRLVYTEVAGQRLGK